MDIANLKVGVNTYSLKDTQARNLATTAKNTADSAEAKSDQAILDSATANTKIDNSKIIGGYTQTTETLEISLEIGSLNNE